LTAPNWTLVAVEKFSEKFGVARHQRRLCGHGESESMTAARRIWLSIEMLLLYVGAPIAVYSLLHDYRVPLFQIFPFVFAIFAVVLTLDRGFSWRESLSRGISLKTLASILGVFAIAAPLLALFAWHDSPSRFLAFPRYAQGVWLMVMVLYPLLSVTTQEIMFRLFFFSRYRALFGNDTQAAIVLNAALFTFAHIAFQNLTTLVISFLGGLLFAWRYEQTRSFWAVVLEHSLYGNLLFTLGLGRYFYTGVSNF
jgi:membrane protease YdiL (CAAX protease family)